MYGIFILDTGRGNDQNHFSFKILRYSVRIKGNRKKLRFNGDKNNGIFIQSLIEDKSRPWS